MSGKFWTYGNPKLGRIFSELQLYKIKKVTILLAYTQTQTPGSLR